MIPISKHFTATSRSVKRIIILCFWVSQKYAEGVDVDQRWKEYLDYEAQIISKYGKKETIHG